MIDAKTEAIKSGEMTAAEYMRRYEPYELRARKAYEQRMRRRAAALDHWIERSRQRVLDARNRGQYRLWQFHETLDGEIVMGENFDATIEQIDEYLQRVAATERSVAAGGKVVRLVPRRRRRAT